MNILGIDYGRRKIGLSLATAQLAEVYGVIRKKTIEEAIERIGEIAKKEKVGKIVVGISEGEMAKETRRFAEILEKKVETPIVFEDETLTTNMAERLSKEAQIKRKKRKAMEDAYAATLILQNYLDKSL